jgi:hypothetical membrane protein
VAKRGAALWIAAAVGYLILEAIAAAGFVPSYSYTRNYISDLGANAPRAGVMHAAFGLQGILFFLGALLIVGTPESRRARTFLGLMAANSLGNIAIAIVHGGAVHRAGAALAIVGGNLAIAAGSAVVVTVGARHWYRRASTLVAALGLLCLLMLLVNSATGTDNLLPDGAWERGSVYSITLWQLVTGAYLLRAGRR